MIIVDNIIGFDNTNVGTKTLTISIGDKTIDFSVIINPKTAINVDSLSDLTIKLRDIAYVPYISGMQLKNTAKAFKSSIPYLIRVRTNRKF